MFIMEKDLIIGNFGEEFNPILFEFLVINDYICKNKYPH